MKILVLEDILIFLRSPKRQWIFFLLWGVGGGSTQKVPANMQTEKACYLQKNLFVSHEGYKQGYAQWVIHDILDVLSRPQGSYPESFVALSSFLAKI